MTSQAMLSVLFGLVLSGKLTASSPTAQSTDLAKHNSQVQHLTYLKDLPKLMFTVNRASNKSKSVQRTTASKSDFSAPKWTATEHLGQVSNFLLGIIYLGLPIGLMLAVLIYDKREMKRAQLIERLERTWAKRAQP